MSSYLRELVLYRKCPTGELVKVRRTVPTFTQPKGPRTVYSSQRSLYCLRVFQPEGVFSLCWGVLMILVIIYQVITVPFFLAFDVEDTYTSLALELVCTVVYMLDICVTCNTSFYRKGTLVTDRKSILRRYARSWLTVDLISSFPYSWTLQTPMTPFSGGSSMRAPALLKAVKLSRIVRTLRLMRVTKIRQHLALLTQKLSHKLSILFTVLYLCLLMTVIAHWAACGFYYIAQLNDSPGNWIFTFNLENAEDREKYVTALYWAMTTLTTTGYGDIVPITTPERIYGSFVMVLSAGVFSYLIGKVGTVISRIERDSNEHRELVMDVTRYLRTAKVPEEVSARALRYIDYVWETRRRRKVLDKTILSGFSEPFKNEISENIFGKVLSRVPSLTLFDDTFLAQLARGVEPEIYAQDDIIFEAGQTSCELYFLEKGTAELYHRSTRHTFKVLKPGHHFGELAFFTGLPRTASVRCLQFSELLSVKRESLLELLCLSPAGKYALELVTAHLKAKDFAAVGLSCYICKETAHLAPECDIARVQIDKQSIKERWVRKRLSAGRTMLLEDECRPLFQRHIRSVHVAKRYSVHNVKTSGWARLKGANYMLSKALEAAHADKTSEHVKVVSKGKDDQMEFCSIHMSERSEVSEESEDMPSPPLSPSRRFSVIGGIKTYQLIDQLRRVPMVPLEQAKSSEESSSESESLHTEEEKD